MDASDRLRQLIALARGAMFVASGLIVMFGDLGPASDAESHPAPLYDMVQEAIAAFGTLPAGALLIAFGVCLTALLFRAVKRSSLDWRARAAMKEYTQ